MAKKKDKEVQGVEQATFTKEQFLNSERYHYKQDIIDVLLDPDKEYTADEVDKMIEEYMEREV